MDAPRGKEFCMQARFEDGTDKIYFGKDEDWCMADIASDADSGKFGNIEFYTGVNNENYVDGSWCPEEERDYSI